MKPIKAPQLIEKGIVIYVPISNEEVYKTSLRISYNKKNPLFNWAICIPASKTIWYKKGLVKEQGILFVYEREEELFPGYYMLEVITYSKDGAIISKGVKTIGLLKTKPTLYIGLPYSAFPSILLN